MKKFRFVYWWGSIITEKFISAPNVKKAMEIFDSKTYAARPIYRIYEVRENQFDLEIYSNGYGW